MLFPEPVMRDRGRERIAIVVAAEIAELKGRRGLGDGDRGGRGDAGVIDGIARCKRDRERLAGSGIDETAWCRVVR